MIAAGCSRFARGCRSPVGGDRSGHAARDDGGWKVADFERKDGPQPTDAAAEFDQAPQL
ncbi:hypothetical protein [Streptomyces sp. NPDC050564]|uniref:hypothetical protein n=1 Tax=Streptomyces sp. NPDC050564 TaxID=3365631 RepID=UPI0037A2DFE9